MITLATILAAFALNVASGRVFTTPPTHYIDTIVMDMECDIAPNCEIATIIHEDGSADTFYNER